MIVVPLGGMDNGDIHGIVANVLIVVVLGHAIIALYRRYVVKDGLLRRMIRPICSSFSST